MVNRNGKRFIVSKSIYAQVSRYKRLVSKILTARAPSGGIIHTLLMYLQIHKFKISSTFWIYNIHSWSKQMKHCSFILCNLMLRALISKSDFLEIDFLVYVSFLHSFRAFMGSCWLVTIYTLLSIQSFCLLI